MTLLAPWWHEAPRLLFLLTNKESDVTRTAKRLLIPLAVALLGAGVAATPSGAWVHNWSCSPLPVDTRCYDPDTAYHGLIETRADSAPSVLPWICSKAVTSSNNVRSTTSGTWCDQNITITGRCLTGISPSSRAYASWQSGSGSVGTMRGTALTPASSAC